MCINLSKLGGYLLENEEMFKALLYDVATVDLEGELNTGLSTDALGTVYKTVGSTW